MSFALLAPAGLALLGALLVPILVHLARRRRAQPTAFAALRWLAPGAPPRSRLQLEEWLLLALRLLLLALLALMLAQPVWRDAPALRGAHTVVVPGVDVTAARAALPPDVAAHWLAPGWPVFDPAAPPPRGQPVASLLRELDAALAPEATLTVLVPAELDGLDAERIRLSRTVDWRVVAAAPRADVAIPAPAPVTLAVRHGAKGGDTVRFIIAAVDAWNSAEPDRYRLDAQPLGAPLAPGTQWLVVLDGALDAPLQAWVEAGGTALVERAADAPRKRDVGAGRIVDPGEPLRAGHSALLLDPAFPAQLKRWLQEPTAPSDRARADAVAPLTGAIAGSPPERPLAPWLALAIAVLFVLERWLANGPRLGSAR